ncbi:MAG: hypothetical protein KDC44_05605, partial [Phaeodactylibacter sp.]|nr:hypothetical protein [Phaeodactylibacter sp.]
DEGLEIYNNQEIFDLLNNGAQAILETVIETSGERLSTTQVEQKSSHSKPPSTQTAATSISSNFNQFINQQEDAIDDLYFLLVGTGLGEGQINKLSEDTATTLLELLALMFPVGQYRIPNEAYLKDAFAVFVEACIWVRQFGSVDNIFARKRKSEPVEEGQQKSTKSSYGTGDPRLGNFEAKQLPKFKTVETEEIIWKVKGYYLDYWFSRFPRPPDAEQKNKDKDKDKGGLTTEQQSFQAYWESLSANNRFFRNTDTNKKVRNQKLGKELIAYFKNIERALKDMGPSSPDELFANETTS